MRRLRRPSWSRDLKTQTVGRLLRKLTAIDDVSLSEQWWGSCVDTLLPNHGLALQMDARLCMHISEPNCNYFTFIRIKWCSPCNFKPQGHQLFTLFGLWWPFPIPLTHRHDYLLTRINLNSFNLPQIDFPPEFTLLLAIQGNKKGDRFDTGANIHRCHPYL